MGSSMADNHCMKRIVTALPASPGPAQAGYLKDSGVRKPGFN